MLKTIIENDSPKVTGSADFKISMLMYNPQEAKEPFRECTFRFSPDVAQNPTTKISDIDIVERMGEEIKTQFIKFILTENDGK